MSEEARWLRPGLLRLGVPPAVKSGKLRGIVFLDRDGVLGELVADSASGRPESPLRVQDVRLIPGAAAAVLRLECAGYLPICVSNQPAAAKGTVSVARLLAVHARVIELLEAEGAKLASSYICLHHPLGNVPSLSGPCDCRKPAPGMLIEAAASSGVELPDCWMVGDTDADMRAGRAVKCRVALLLYPGSAHKRLQGLSPDMTAVSLADAVADTKSIDDSESDRRNIGMLKSREHGHHSRTTFDTHIRRRRRSCGHPRSRD